MEGRRQEASGAHGRNQRKEGGNPTHNPTFKELLEQDVKNVFLNLEEFGEVHTVNEKEMVIIIDNNEQIEREKRTNQRTDGIYKNQKLIYVATSDFGPLPKQGARLVLDKKNYTVMDAISEDGIYSITVEAGRAL